MPEPLPLSDARLTEIRARHERSSASGEWRTLVQHEAVADLCALLAEVDRLRADLELVAAERGRYLFAWNHARDRAQSLAADVEMLTAEADHLRVQAGTFFAQRDSLHNAVIAECDAIVQEVYGQHDEDDDGMREAVQRIRGAVDAWRKDAAAVRAPSR
jgi:hypothetical protein